MKKSKVLIVFAICVAIALMFTGCGDKTAITSDTFKNIMIDMGYQIGDISNQYEDADHVLEVYVAVDSTESYQIEFYKFADETAAKTVFNGNKEQFEELYGENGGVRTSVSVGNHGEFRLLIDGEYILMSQITDTLVFSKTTSDYKDAVNEAVDTLGY